MLSAIPYLLIQCERDTVVAIASLHAYVRLVNVKHFFSTCMLP